MSRQIAFIDHYDSFSSNVVAWLEKDAEVQVRRFYSGRLPMDDIIEYKLPLVFSPGPGRPTDYPDSLELMRRSLGHVSILGVCLGHQMLGHLAGFKVVKSEATWHGTVREIEVLKRDGFFSSAPSKMEVATYNSLCLESDREDPAIWGVSARNKIGEIEAIEHLVQAEAPAVGIQFHPESFLSVNGASLLVYPGVS